MLLFIKTKRNVGAKYTLRTVCLFYWIFFLYSINFSLSSKKIHFLFESIVLKILFYNLITTIFYVITGWELSTVRNKTEISKTNLNISSAFFPPTKASAGRRLCNKLRCAAEQHSIPHLSHFDSPSLLRNICLCCS